MTLARHRTHAAGLTLVEMIVVLVILVLVAGTAVQATEGLVEQQRREQTRRTLDSLEDAVLGGTARVGADAATDLAGFVADMGRLPARGADADAALRLSELWSRPSAAPDCGPQQPRTDDLSTVLDADVVLVAGWRGPYLRLPVGAPSLTDGWGRAFELRKADGTATASGDAVEIVTSLGADDAAGGAGTWDGDLEIVFRRASAPVVSARHLGSVSGTVTPDAGGAANVVVRVFGPVDGHVKELADPQVFSSASGTQTFSFNTIPAGPRAIRAYQVATAPAKGQTLPSPPTHRSRVRHLVVPAGGVSGVTLEVE